MKKFLNSPAGSWLKVFIAAVAAQLGYLLAENQSFLTWDWVMIKRLIYAGVAALLPVIINWANPEDQRYGATNDKDKGGDRPVRPTNPQA